ncbi:hypothetical protein ACFVT5_04880 [Streptomyces sp. NPDC058001]|uniref:hypothetical protein n=1 Tax=Streptomyces sp. NPDC058001 TaxID=3346300 RepID=UPI0036EF6A83
MSGTSVLAATLASVVVALAGPGVADADAAALCAGRKVRTLPFSTGDVLVYKKSGYVCAVTVADKAGSRRTMSVSVQARGSRPVQDKGQYTQHAGPVKVHAGHRCVWVRGAIASKSVSSGWILC